MSEPYGIPSPLGIRNDILLKSIFLAVESLAKESSPLAILCYALSRFLINRHTISLHFSHSYCYVLSSDYYCDILWNKIIISWEVLALQQFVQFGLLWSAK